MNLIKVTILGLLVFCSNASYAGGASGDYTIKQIQLDSTYLWVKLNTSVVSTATCAQSANGGWFTVSGMDSSNSTFFSKATTGALYMAFAAGKFVNVYFDDTCITMPSGNKYNEIIKVDIK